MSRLVVIRFDVQECGRNFIAVHENLRILGKVRTVHRQGIVACILADRGDGNVLHIHHKVGCRVAVLSTVGVAFAVQQIVLQILQTGKIGLGSGLCLMITEHGSLMNTCLIGNVREKLVSGQISIFFASPMLFQVMYLVLKISPDFISASVSPIVGR